MNAFKKHGIEYLSASTINTWIMQPAYALLKISGTQDEFASPAAYRGRAVDKAAAMFAKSKAKSNKEKIKSECLAEFDDTCWESSFMPDDKKVKSERASVPKMIDQAYNFYSRIEAPLKEEQGRVKINIPDVPVPWIGYFDLLFEKEVREVKSVGRMQSTISAAHARQAAIYSVGTGREAWVDYISTTQVKSFRLTKAAAVLKLKELQIAARSLETVLSYSDDILECCQCVFPDLDHWIWGPTTTERARDIWSIGV
jgi:hypothetical protein